LSIRNPGDLKAGYFSFEFPLICEFKKPGYSGQQKKEVEMEDEGTYQDVAFVPGLLNYHQ
jgi:hypothetical protein